MNIFGASKRIEHQQKTSTPVKIKQNVRALRIQFATITEFYYALYIDNAQLFYIDTT